MNNDAQDDSEYSASEPNSDISHGDNELRLPKNAQVETIEDSPRSSPFKGIANSTKWNTLRTNYQPRYLEFFRETWQRIDSDTDDADNFETTQYGAVTWTGAEKARLFRALDCHGRHDLAMLSERVVTKSEIEIHAYLELLRQAELERQLYERHHENFSVVDMPAAVEMGLELEGELDRAAEATEAYQEQYDYAVAARGEGVGFVVDGEVARGIDARNDAREQREGNADRDVDENSGSEDYLEFFRLSTLIELSAKLFMIGTSDSPNRRPASKGGRRVSAKKEPDDWLSLAFGDETPAFTRDAISDIYAIITSLIQRFIQTTIFFAESRLRATTSSHWRPIREVRRDDVHLAVDMLKLERNSIDFWIGWPRRAGVAVWSGSHRKGASLKQEIEISTAEEILSKPVYRGRHSRSASVSSASSVSSDSTMSAVESLQEAGQDEGATDGDFELSAESMGASSDDASESPTDSDGDTGEDYDEDTGSEDNNLVMEEGEHSGPQPRPTKIPSQKRKRMLEKELNQYLKEIDARDSLEEQERIRQILNDNQRPRIKEESEPPRKRPRVSRKAVEDVEGWQAPALAAWEAYEELPELERKIYELRRNRPELNDQTNPPT